LGLKEATYSRKASAEQEKIQVIDSKLFEVFAVSQLTG
jgi:hypothetical protein